MQVIESVAFLCPAIGARTTVNDLVDRRSSVSIINGAFIIKLCIGILKSVASSYRPPVSCMSHKRYADDQRVSLCLFPVHHISCLTLCSTMRASNVVSKAIERKRKLGSGNSWVYPSIIHFLSR